MMSNKSGKFHAGQQVKYGLKVTSCHPKSSEVVSVMCCFCAASGGEEKVGDKGNETKNVKYITNFRASCYTSHYEGQHPKGWAEY